MFQQFLFHHHICIPPSALLFPAVNPRRRYLIHNTVQENFPQLTTLSVGEGDQRRTAVTFKKNYKQYDAVDDFNDEEKASLTDRKEQSQEENQYRKPPVAESESRKLSKPQGQSVAVKAQQSPCQTKEKPTPARTQVVKPATERIHKENRRPEQLLYSPQRQLGQQRIELKRGTQQQATKQQQTQHHKDSAQSLLSQGATRSQQQKDTPQQPISQTPTHPNQQKDTAQQPISQTPTHPNQQEDTAQQPISQTPTHPNQQKDTAQYSFQGASRPQQQRHTAQQPFSQTASRPQQQKDTPQQNRNQPSNTAHSHKQHQEHIHSHTPAYEGCPRVARDFAFGKREFKPSGKQQYDLHNRHQQQQQRQQQHLVFRNRSRSCNSEARSSSAHSTTVEASSSDYMNYDNHMRNGGTEESRNSIRRRRNRKNRRQRDPQINNNENDRVNGRSEELKKGVSRKSESLGNISCHSISSTYRGNSVAKHTSVSEISEIPCAATEKSDKTQDIGNGDASSAQIVTCKGGAKEARVALPVESNTGGDEDSYGTASPQLTIRSPPSNSKDELLESGSSSPKDPLAKASPERMPVTVPSDQGSNRRRGKAAAQIYRPPPARSSQDTNFSPQSQQQLNHYQQHPYQPQQQQYQLHQPAYSQRYQPRPHNAKANHNVLQQQELQQYQPVSRQRTDSESSTATVSNEYHNNKVRGRRPDQVLYVPRGRRHLPNDPGSARGTPTPLADYESHQRPPSPAYSICSTASEFSGRNRYNKQGGSCLGSQISIYDGEIDKVHGKPPLSRDFSRESTPGNGRHKGNGGRFSTHTLSLIERCLNQDSEQRYNEYSNFETDSVHNSPSPKHSKVGGGSYRAQKSPTPTRDIHSIHSKENVIHPFEPGSRARKSRKNRKRHSRSRDHSSEHYNYAAKDSNSKGNVSHNGEWQNSPGERGFGSCERIFYNSNFNSSQDRYDRGYDNYDRYSSINSSRASSRNSSRERTPQRNINQNWRGGSNPPSPSKGPVIFYHSNHSSGKPPSGRLGSLPNVSFDSEETPGRRLSYHNEENNKYYTLPGKSNDPAFSNSHSQATVKNNIEYGSGCIVSDRIDTELSSSVTCTTIPDNDLTTQNQITDGYCLQNEDICNKDFHSSSSSHESEVVTDVTNQLQDYTVVKDGAVSMQECNSKEENGLMITPDNSENLFIDTENLPEPLDGSIKNVSIQDNQFLSADDASVNSADVSSEVTHEHDSYYDAVAEPAMSESLKESTDEIVSSDNDIKDNSHKDTKENITEVEEKVKKNPKKFLFDWADEVEDSWDSLYDDNGECLDPNIKRQLSNSLGKIKLEKPANDYYSFQPKEPEISEEEYGHVIEIYDFPVSFKTQDLMMVFSSFQNTGFDIKWVDDTHALGIFATALIAAEALSVDHPFLKTRSLSLATKSSKAKAMRITDALLPYKPRPATSASLARRLVSGALGLKVNISREVREAERQKLKDAKAQKRLAAKQRVDAWEGNLA